AEAGEMLERGGGARFVVGGDGVGGVDVNFAADDDGGNLAAGNVGEELGVRGDVARERSVVEDDGNGGSGVAAFAGHVANGHHRGFGHGGCVCLGESLLRIGVVVAQGCGQVVGALTGVV